ncbi:hypothetical protein OHC33_004432 [Knufia fluminis]|uniref:Uncharacterized protein n=1 Tax=Knufia fluminis TaxID=191047 RepID=A0AAN8EFZ5_9EURO|nr:hypothetical protein OHC33_004432 [Knufia fluminis]
MSLAKDDSTQLVFEQPANPQTFSRLFQLPAEIRLKIYRLLFKNDRPLYAIDEFDDYPYNRNEYGLNKSTAEADFLTLPYRSNVSLSAQTLASCQQFYCEGQVVLYKANVLSIYCHFGEDQAWCDSLDSRVELPFDITDLPRDNFGLLDLAVSSGVHNVHSFSSRYSILSRFETFRMVFSVWDRSDCEPMAVCCRVLRELLHDKHLTIVPLGYSVNSLRSHDYHLFKPTRNLHCKAVDLDLSHMDSSTTANDLHRALEEIVSGGPVQDTVATFLSLMPRLDTIVDATDDTVLLSMLERLKVAAITYDADAFEVLFELIKKSMLKFQKDWMNSKMKNSRSRGS